MVADRKIGFWMCTALVVGNVIGMGIFLLPASLAPYGFNALIGWAVTLLGCLALAQVFSYLARTLPDADGPYVYIRRTLGEIPAFVALWAYWASIGPTNAALATGVVGYLGAVFPASTAAPPAALALCLLWAVVAINLLGVRAGGTVQVVTTVLKLLPMLAVVVLGGWILLHSPASYAAHPPATPIGLGAVMTASALALYAMIGIESAMVPAGRVADPGRTIPRATIVGTIATTLIYTAVSAVPLLLIPQHELARSGAPLSLLMNQFAGADMGRWLALFVVISGLGALNGWTLLVAELTRTMAANGVMPAVLGRSNRFGAPASALLVIGALGSITILMSYSRSLVSAFTLYTQVVTAANLPLYLGCVLVLMVLWRRGSIAGASRAALVPIVVGLLYVGFAFVGAGVQAVLLMLGLCVAGMPLYAIMRWHRRRAGDQISEVR